MRMSRYIAQRAKIILSLWTVPPTRTGPWEEAKEKGMDKWIMIIGLTFPTRCGTIPQE
jgi:hypothetical protein